MKAVILVALLIAGAIAQSVPSPSINATNFNGFDIIVLDSPSWVTHIQSTYQSTESFYVFGDQTLRAIQGGNNTSGFYASPLQTPWRYPLIDLHTFYFTDATNNVIQYTFGPTEYSPDNDIQYDTSVGPYTPLFTAQVNLSTSNPASQRIQPTVNKAGIDYNGILASALRVDLTNMATNLIVTYWAGFIIDANNSVMTANFSLLRTAYIPNANNQFDPDSNTFIYHANEDIFPLYSNKFASFSATYKPSVHFVPYWGPNNHTIVLVVDPNTRTLYMVDVNASPSQSPQTFQWGTNYEGMDLVSDTFHNQKLVVGLAASGFAPGWIFIFDFSATAQSGLMPTPSQYTLPSNYSNPKALSLDSTAENLYIGFNGYNEVIQMNTGNGSVVGYQRLPYWIHGTWAATQSAAHVYFVTYEQNSKVFRVNKQDFCPATCPYYGYCTGGKCECGAGYVMSKDKSTCYLAAAREVISVEHHYHVAHGGEIALGILFALTFIAAAAGWFLWWRGRGGRGAYQAV